MNAPARTSGDPARYPASVEKTRSSNTGTKPRRASSCTPRSNSSRAKGLAGATTAIRSPLFSARGFSMSDETRHLVDDALVSIAAKHVTERLRPACRHGCSEESLFRASQPCERLLQPFVNDAVLFDGVHERLECGRLDLDVAAADQQRVAARRDGIHRRVGH